MPHIPVLLKEVIEILNPQPGEFFIDGTIGSGGHTIEIIKRISPDGILLAVDWDKDSLEKARERIEPELKTKNYKLKTIWVQGNYADLPEILEEYNLGKADGLILDLGFSSEQLSRGRGFSFQKNEPLDMRYDTREGMTAGDVLNRFSEKDLAEIFWKYGEERYSRKIAAKIVEERKKKKIETSFDLVEIVLKSLFNKGTSDVRKLTSIFGTSDVQKLKIRGRIHPATRIFQALRIFVNQELENLETLLKNLPEIIKSPKTLPRQSALSPRESAVGKGRVAIISFHSLEDRLVKNYFRELKKQGKPRIAEQSSLRGRALILTKKPITPSEDEIKSNPRCRSAKLRAIVFR
jgi:16S rRNA (cytosine1402-N4)-methyltransferase